MNMNKVIAFVWIAYAVRLVQVAPSADDHYQVRKIASGDFSPLYDDVENNWTND